MKEIKAVESVNARLLKTLRKINAAIDQQKDLSLQLDSIELIQFAADIEKEFGIEVGREEIKLGLLRDYGKAVEIIEKLIEKTSR